MPTYDYVCAACGHAFEHFQDMSAKRLRTCPRCKKPKLERQVGTGSGLIFKGSGFYITDYRRGGGAGPATPPVVGQKADGKKSEGDQAARNEPKGPGGNNGAPSAPSNPPGPGGSSKAEAPTPPSKPSKGRSGK